MLTDAIRNLILDEQARQHGRFIAAADLDAYLRKLDDRAEILADSLGPHCRGFVAFYGNDLATRQAFITLVLVAPEHRATGLGKALVAGVLEICRQRGFTTCRLEVRTDNAAALGMYQSIGFAAVEERDGTQILERAL